MEGYNAHIEAFEWDTGNTFKSKQKHSVTNQESEEVFFNTPLIVLSDPLHSADEVRYLCLGTTHAGRRLFLSFTIRDKTVIRIISARDMNKKERTIYENKKKDTKI